MFNLSFKNMCLATVSKKLRAQVFDHRYEKASCHSLTVQHEFIKNASLSGGNLRQTRLFYSASSFHAELQKDTSRQTNVHASDYLQANDEDTQIVLSTSMKVYDNFISQEEEGSILNEIEPYLRRLRYETSHWDDAIHGYRETERKHWTEKNKQILQRVKDLAFPPGVAPLAYIHILDLQKTGYIKPHIDAVRFCGDTIAGLSLLSSCVMRLTHEKDEAKYADILLKRRSLYIMKNVARYDYKHEVLPEEKSVFKGTVIPKERRISVICRNEP
ncbi:hypothetical protein CHS0354_011029 [Potamilus streckersoni]|uniref:Alpha-ketoglutarate-dependent dioxygenase AlkB-like domain-containing protein n=1 Tax=Potamilus streckersoni TaxID=2493646 RepID=A0AAE0TLA0_9BIVA|nr:hypothetical protein CHS0354_011029 [Potamilus streckersoni]